MSMDVVEAGQNLIEYALDTFRIHTLVIPGFHQLVQVAVHVLHTDMQFPAVWVKEDIQGRNQVDVNRKRAQEDDLP